MPQNTHDILSKIIFNQVSDALVILDLDYKILEANQSFLQLIARGNEEVIGKTIDKLVLFSANLPFSDTLEIFKIEANKEIILENSCLDLSFNFSYDLNITKIFSEELLLGLLCKFSPSEFSKNELIRQKRSGLQKQSDALFELTKKAFWKDGNLEECFRAVTEIAAKTLDISSCGIWVFEGEYLVCNVFYTTESDMFSEGLKLLCSKYPNYINTLRNDGIVDASDAWKDPRSTEFVQDYFIPNNVKSILDTPIKYAGELYGIFCCEQNGQQRVWQLDEKNFASYLCETISHVISIHKENEFKKDLMYRERYFKSLIDSSLDVICTIDKNAKYTFLSPAITRSFGYEVNELLGKLAFDYIHPEDIEKTTEVFKNLMTATGNVVQANYRFKHKNGHWVDVWGMAKNMLEVEGVNGIVVNARDITESIAAEREILRKEKYFRLLTENSFDVRYTSDAIGTITYISPSILEILGYTSEEVLGKNGWYFIADEYKEFLRAEWAKLCEKDNQMMYYQLKLIRKDQRLIEVELVAKNMLNDPDINGVIITFRDITERKSFEKKLSESEEYFRSLIENSNDAMTIVNAEGKRTYASPSSEKVFGYPVEKLLGQSPFDVVHPDDLEYAKITFNELCQVPDLVKTSEVRVMHPIKKDWITLEITAKNLLHNKVVNGVVLNSRDITESLKFQQKLKDSEEYFRALIENSSDVISVIDELGNRKFTSLSVQSIFGRKPEDILGKSPMDIVHPEDLSKIRLKLIELLENPGVPIRTEARMSNAAGEWLTVDAVGRNLLHNPAVRGIVLNARDITETKIAQQKLAMSEKYYRSLIENSNDMLAICDSQANFLYSSPSVERFMGYAQDEYLSTNLKNYIHYDFIPSFEKVFEKALKHPGITFKQELYQKHKSGHYIYLETIFNNLLQDEAVKGIVMVSRDISDRKNAELILQNYNMQLSSEVNAKTLELKNKNSRLEELINNLKSAQAQLVQSEKMASLGLLTAGIAHEINNPINFITANIKPLRRDIHSLKEFLEVIDSFQFITDDTKLKEANKIKKELEIDYALEEINQLLNGIEEGAVRTFEIVKGLRNFSRLDESDLKMDDLNQSLHTTILLIHSNFDKKINFEKRFGKIPLVECYPGKLNQVFMNIISNAAQAIQDEGKIIITTSYEKSSDKVVIDIEDTGIGMSTQVMDRIFEPFYTNKKVGEGTGLGLFISFGIIESHRGKILVSSEEGKGSKFSIYLPLKQTF